MCLGVMTAGISPGDRPAPFCCLHPFWKLHLWLRLQSSPRALRHTTKLTAAVFHHPVSQNYDLICTFHPQCGSLLFLLSIRYQILSCFYVLCITKAQAFSSLHHSMAFLPFSRVTHPSLFTSGAYSPVGVKLVWKYTCCWRVDTSLGCTINRAPWSHSNNKKQLDST